MHQYTAITNRTAGRATGSLYIKPMYTNGLNVCTFVLIFFTVQAENMLLSTIILGWMKKLLLFPLMILFIDDHFTDHSYLRMSLLIDRKTLPIAPLKYHLAGQRVPSAN